MGAEVLLALGAVGDRKQGKEQQRIGPFSHRAIIAMANMADQITHQSQQEELLERPLKVAFKTLHWVEIALKDEKGIAVENQPWWIKTPDGTRHTGKTTVKGTARISDIQENGECQICFPGISVLKNNKPPPPSQGGSSGTYIVQQGDTLTRIAKANGLGGYKDLYNHPLNKSFRKKRPDPNLIYPGDKITIPEPMDTPFVERMDTTHRFVLNEPKETLTIEIEGLGEMKIEGKRAVLKVGDITIDETIGKEGLLTLELPNLEETTGELSLYLDDTSDNPTQVYEINLAHLDPVDTPSGIQARCNALGFNCGEVDGIIGEKTRKAIRAFQADNNLTVDGEAGPETQKILQKLYGC